MAYAPGTDGEPCALCLGLMCWIQRDGQQFHACTCGTLVQARPPALVQQLNGSKRAAQAVQSVLNTPVRASVRRGVASGYMTLNEVHEELGGANEGGSRRYPGTPPFKGNLHCCGGASDIELVRKNDMIKVAKRLICALLGLGGGLLQYFREQLLQYFVKWMSLDLISWMLEPAMV